MNGIATHDVPAAAAKNTLTLEKLCYSIDEQEILQDISLTLNSGQVGCLLGPSGSGKTTLLRLVADLLQPDRGRILLNGKSIDDYHKANNHFPVSMVFQDLGLFPHMSVMKNICYGLRQPKSEENQAIITQTLQQLQLQDYTKRYPHELSGGQQQRVALARALVIQPKILLMDEPFSNLDPALRVPLAEDLAMLLREKNLITLVVTHDRQEALSMGDYIGVLGDHKLQQWDTPENLLTSPQSPFVIRFTGHNALVNGVITENNSVKTVMGEFELDPNQDIANLKAYERVKVYMRSIDNIVSHEPDDSLVPAVVTYRNYEANEFVYALKLENNERLFATCHSKKPLDVGSHVFIRTVLRQARVFSHDSVNPEPVS